MKRTLIKRWHFDMRYTFYHPSSPPKHFIRYVPENDLSEARWMRQKKQELGIKGTDDLAKIALYAGSHSRLWVGGLDGIIAPMDAQPEGWTYANEEPVEASWFWQWHPSERSREEILRELEKTNPLNLDKQPTIFKSLVPFQLERKMGTIQDIGAINVVELPNYIRNDVPYIFETDA